MSRQHPPLLSNPAFVRQYTFSAPTYPPGPAHVAPYEVPSSVPRMRRAESTGSSDRSYERTHRQCKEWAEEVEKTRAACDAASAPTPNLNPAFVVPYAFSAPMHPHGPAHVAPYAFSAPMRPPGPAHVAPYAVPTMMHPPTGNPTASYEVPTFSSGQMNSPPFPRKRHAESTGSSNRSNKRTRREDRFGIEEAEATLVSLEGPIRAACDAFIDWYGRLDREEEPEWKREYDAHSVALAWKLFTQIYSTSIAPDKLAKIVLPLRMASQAGVAKNANALFQLFESAWNVAFGIEGHHEDENSSTHEED